MHVVGGDAVELSALSVVSARLFFAFMVEETLPAKYFVQNFKEATIDKPIRSQSEEIAAQWMPRHRARHQRLYHLL